jgi:glutaredoxin
MVKVTLYHWNKCNHCVAFKPQWNTLTEELFKRNNIQFVDYELERDGDKIRSAKIEAFPTVIVENKDKSVIIEGPTVDDLVHAVFPSGIPNQMGGANLKNSIRKAMINQVMIMKKELFKLRN